MNENIQISRFEISIYFVKSVIMVFSNGEELL